MKLLFLIVLTIGLSKIYGQDFKNLALIKESVSNKEETNEQFHIKVPQFLDHCIYDQKCGIFLSESFKKFGLMKATFLSIDRRLRCGSLTKSQMLPVRFDTDGLIMDYAEDYSF